MAIWAILVATLAKNPTFSHDIEIVHLLAHDRLIGLPMLRPMHRPMPSADGTIGFFQTIGRWISLKNIDFPKKWQKETSFEKIFEKVKTV